MTFILKADPLCATSRPTLPSPITPRVLPASSTPVNLLFSHLPALREAVACGRLRARAMSMLKLCSAADTEFPPGVFITTTPRRVAADTSILSTPAPARPTTRRR